MKIIISEIVRERIEISIASNYRLHVHATDPRTSIDEELTQFAIRIFQRGGGVDETRGRNNEVREINVEIRSSRCGGRGNA